MSNPKAEMDKREVFKQFLDKHDVLIVDKNPTSRNRLLKIMQDLGARKGSVHTAGTMDEADKFLTDSKIGIILSDYVVGGGSGFGGFGGFGGSGFGDFGDIFERFLHAFIQNY